MKKRSIIAILFILFLSACPGDIRIDGEVISVLDNETYYADVQAVIEAWDRNPNLPPYRTSTCHEENIFVAVLDPKEFESITGYCPPAPDNRYCQEYYGSIGHSCPWGCAGASVVRSGNSFESCQHQEDLIILIPDVYPEEEIYYAIRHETIHWLSSCTGHQSIRGESGGYPYSAGDAKHIDLRLWDWNDPSSVVRLSRDIFDEEHQ